MALWGICVTYLLLCKNVILSQLLAHRYNCVPTFGVYDVKVVLSNKYILFERLYIRL